MKKVLSIIALTALLCTAANSHALTPVSGNITSDTTWSGEILMHGAVFVKPPATLTIQPGTIIYGEKATKALLVIERGAKIHAVGTKDNGILFTSDQPAASRQRADWGGLCINGYSTLNVPGGTKLGEGDSGTFGCTAGVDCNEADNSGTMQYVREEYSGIQFTPDNELNGIAFQGVGSGTTVDHIQVAYSKDDCIEFFGGTMNMHHAIMTACGDDTLDWTDGWRGKVQFVVGQQKGDECNNGIEADNLDKANESLPRSAPTIYNATFIGHDNATSVNAYGKGLQLRRGTAGKLRNFIVMGFNQGGVDLNDASTQAQADAGNLVFDNNIFYNNTLSSAAYNFYPDTATVKTTTFMTSTMQHNVVADPLLGAAFNLTSPDFRPGTGSPAINGTVPVATPPSDGFFTAVNYIGAVDPNNDWTRQPWTKYGVASWTPTDNTTDNCTENEKVTYYRDADSDTYGSASVTTRACEAPAGYVTNSTDCNDSDAACHTGDCCDNGTDCVMTVKPASVVKAVSFFFPFRFFTLLGDDNAAFTQSDKPVWGADGLQTLFSRVAANNKIVGLMLVRPFKAEAGEYEVTAGNCTGTIEIK